MKNIAAIAPHDTSFYYFRKELIEKLISLNYTVHLICPFGRNIDYFNELGCKTHNVVMDRRGTNPLNDYNLYKQYKKILKDIRPDVCLTYSTKPSVYGGFACSRLKIPYIVNNSGLKELKKNEFILRSIMNRLYYYGFINANLLMYQNSHEANVINKVLHGKVQYKIIPGSGVNLDKYKYCDYPANDDKLIFNFVGRIVDIKGINEYIEVAKIIKSKYPNVEFRVYGEFESNYFKELINDAKLNNYVNYMGLAKDMTNPIQESHAVIHPSYYEGMTNACLEHSAMGRPCIGSNIPGVREIIDDGITGYTFNVKNVDDIVTKVEKFIQLSHNDKIMMGKAARQKMEKEFDRKLVTDIYLNAVEKIIDNFYKK